MREDLTGDDDSSFSWCLLPVATSCWAGLNKSKSLVSAAALCFAAGANTYNKFHPSHYIRCSGWPSLALTVPSRPPSTVWTNLARQLWVRSNLVNLSYSDYTRSEGGRESCLGVNHHQGGPVLSELTMTNLVANWQIILLPARDQGFYNNSNCCCSSPGVAKVRQVLGKTGMVITLSDRYK